MKKKIVTLCLSAALVATLLIGGTLAYFTDEDDATNTFTVGKVDIILDETDTDGSNTDPTTEGRDRANDYHLLPGEVHTKDPRVTVKANSEESYVRMLVTVKNIANLEAAITDKSYYADGVFLLQMLTNGTWNEDSWAFESYKEDGADGIYEFRHTSTVEKSATDTVLLPLFEEIALPDYLDNADAAKLLGNPDDASDDVSIYVEAHAIQVQELSTDDAAWAAFDAQN